MPSSNILGHLSYSCLYWWPCYSRYIAWKMSREASILAVDSKGDFDTCCENCVRLPCRWWTVWETSTQAVDRVGDFHTSHLQLGRLPHLVWLSWVTSTPTMDSVGDFIVHCHFTITWPSPNWCFTITFVDNSILLCCYFTVTLLLHHLLPHCFLISRAIVKKLCTWHSQCYVLILLVQIPTTYIFSKINKLSYCRRRRRRRKDLYFVYKWFWKILI